jgi:hypothetical protein
MDLVKVSRFAFKRTVDSDKASLYLHFLNIGHCTPLLRQSPRDAVEKEPPTIRDRNIYTGPHLFLFQGREAKKWDSVKSPRSS